MVNTTNANGPFGGPALSGGTLRNFAIPSGACGIPGTAQAYSLNFTVIPSGTLNYLTVWPSRARVTETDALGRVTNVWEDPSGFNYPTGYTYDVLNDLVMVNQSGQSRTFGYDSLGRLQSATNPESGTTSYIYYNSGNVQTKTDARSVVTTYGYDALNRIGSKSYSDGTAVVSYTYDQGGASARAIGQLTQVSAKGVSATVYGGFDALGRATASSQATAGQTYSFAYTYNLAGALTSETYPSGRVVTTSYDGANRTVQVAGVLGMQRTDYVWGATYAPQGPTKGYWYGGNVARIDTYNQQLQHADMWDSVNNSPNTYLFYMSPTWGTTNNNGSLQGTKTYVGNAVPWGSLTQFNQAFTYDSVNRLTAGSDSGGWSQTYSYDAWGNMTMAGNPVPAYAPTAFNGNNRVSGASYDNAGNQLGLGPYTLGYDAENRQITETNTIGNPAASYAYDGNGQRVERVVAGSGTTIYVYDALGQMAAEYSSAAAATPPCQTCFLTYDHLGTPRMVTDQNANVIARHDYLPFGQEVPGNTYGRGSGFGAGLDNLNQKFTGQERDTETQMDFFQARYFALAQGRFNSPDPANAGASLTNPQSWNGYSYVWNNPLGAIDPTGLHVDSPDPTYSVTSTACSWWQIWCWLGGVSSDNGGSSDDSGAGFFSIPSGAQGSGGGGGGGSAPTQPPKNVTSASQAPSALLSKINSLLRPCSSVLPSRSALETKANQLSFWDARVNGSVPVSMVPGAVPVPSGATIASSVGGANAVTLWGPNYSISSNVVLGTGFFIKNYPAQQTILLHELLHYTLQKSDQQVDQKYNIVPGPFDSFSSAFNNWLTNNCQGG